MCLSEMKDEKYNIAKKNVISQVLKRMSILLGE